jgi:YHS domain-containing protein
MKPIIIKPLLSALIILIVVFTALSQPEAARKTNYNLKKGIAIEGYDPVSYFAGKPKMGNENIKLTYQGVTYLFSNSANLNTFKSNPKKYEPAYGGWCAYAMGESGEKVKIDPETYKIFGGKLYLFYNFWGNNTRSSWNKNEAKLKAAGDHNWEKIINK